MLDRSVNHFRILCAIKALEVSGTRAENDWGRSGSEQILETVKGRRRKECANPLYRLGLPAQPVDATPSNALIRQCFPGRSDLLGCTRSKPSQGGVPADLTLESDLAFVFNASRVRSECCVDPLNAPSQSDTARRRSFSSQGYDRINCGCAPSREIARNQRHKQKQKRNARDGRHIPWRYTKEHTGDEPCGRQRRRNAEGCSQKPKHKRFSENEPENTLPLRP
jgi:hypothetical protein